MFSKNPPITDDVPKINAIMAARMYCFTRYSVWWHNPYIREQLRRVLFSNIRILILVIYLPSVLFAQINRYEFKKPLMGSPFRLVFYAGNDSLARKAADSTFARIEMLNGVMSDYKDGSEINRLSAQAGTGKWIPVSPELLDILRQSQQISRQTNGYFDVTVGPAVQLWRRSIRRNLFPDKRELKEARRRVGYSHLLLDVQKQSVRLTRERMRLDVGGIGKGYAADAAIPVLRSFGITSAMVDAGGDLTLSAPPPGTEGWKIEVDSGTNRDSTITLTLSHVGIATSGANYRYLEHKGKKYSHLVDPKTGIGLTSHIRTTVIAPTGTLADALATAMSVAGIKKGKRIKKNFPELKVWLLEVREGRTQSWKLLDL